MKYYVPILFLFMSILLFLIIGCTQDGNVQQVATTIPECEGSSDCVIGGCSSHLCVQKTDDEVAGGFFTTCEYKEEYTCVRLTNCGCVQGRCQWEQTDEFQECLDTTRRAKFDPIPVQQP